MYTHKNINFAGMNGIPAKIYFHPSLRFRPEIEYAWNLFASNKKIKSSTVQTAQEANLVLSFDEKSDLPLAENFYQALQQKQLFEHTAHFKSDCYIRTHSGRIDYLATAFYIVNAFQEYNTKETDEIGRFKYSNSFQHKFGVIEDNLVQVCFDRLLQETPKLQPFASASEQTSAVFLSHDIDSVYGAVLQDSLHVLKKANLAAFLQLFVRHLTGKPDWLNMDRIMQMESEYDFKSTFYWLVTKGRVSKREVNADYSLQEKKIQHTLASIKEKGWENGIHKSISPLSLPEEIEQTKAAGLIPLGNRYHYLKFSLPQAYTDLEASGLSLDSSMGFAEAIGFRTGYGKPFVPYNLQLRKPHSFLEVPLNIMDGTLQRYNQVPVANTASRIIPFLEKNKTNCVLSVLWHNTFFTEYKYKGYLEEYKKLLAYFYDNKFRCVTQADLIATYLNSNPSS
jgi:hypothetical protein